MPTPRTHWMHFNPPLKKEWNRATCSFDIRVKGIQTLTLEVSADYCYEKQLYDLNYAYLGEELITRTLLEQLVPPEDLIHKLEFDPYGKPAKDKDDDY